MQLPASVAELERSLKKRLHDLLNGKIEYEREGLVFSVEKVTGSVLEGENYRGRFSVRTRDKKPVQGFLHSTSPRLGMKPESFAGTEETFRFEADMSGMKAGSQFSGEFVLSTSVGEFHLPYEFSVGKKRSAQKEVLPEDLTLEQFAEMAQEEFGKAYVLFLSEGFAERLESWGPKYGMLYEGILRKPASYQSLEQFLVGAQLKMRNRIFLASEHLCFQNVGDNRKEELEIRKSTWGFSSLTITSDAPFLTVERENVTTEEFVGSVYYAGFMIHREKLHPGKNFARLTVTMEGESCSCVVEVYRNKQMISENSLHRQKQELIQTISGYLDYRTGKVELEEWAQMTLRNLDNYRRAGGRDLFWDLYEVYVLFLKKDVIHGELLLQQAQERREELKVPARKGCCLYLTAMQSQDQEYIDYVKAQIRELFLENQENWMLQWLMLQVNGDFYRNDTQRLDALRSQYLRGCRSPLLYLEAYKLLKMEPLLLRRLEAFEIHVLAFACREHILDREICGQTAQLAGRIQGFDPILFRILEECCTVYPTVNMLTAICTLLIQGRKISQKNVSGEKNRRYAKWLEMGIKEDVRLTGLYEYFVETAPDLNDKLLPSSVRMYFIYHNTLDYVRKAAIYANIVRNRGRDEETYESYQDSIARFMEEQLCAGRINRDLAVLDQALLTHEAMTPQLAEGLEKALFTWEVTCGNPGMKAVIVVQRALEQEQKVMLTEGKACVQIYGPDCCILTEDIRGCRYAAEDWCCKERLLEGTELENWCREFSERPSGMLLHDCAGKQGGIHVTAENAGDYIRILGLKNINRRYRIGIRRELTRYFAANSSDPRLEVLLSVIDCREAVVDQKRETAVLLARMDRYEELFQLVCQVGTEGIDLPLLVRMCSSCIAQREGEQDPMLTAVCAYCFTNGLYEETMLEYLMRYFEGSIETMKAVWYAASAFKLESYEFEERILGLVLFQLQGMERTEPIFASYEKKAGEEKLCRAYVVLMSYEYFVREKETGAPVFAYLERNMLGNPETPQVCLLAMLKYLCGLRRKSAGQQKWMVYLLQKYVSGGKRFAFLEELPEKLRRQFHLHDKVILEYRTAPGSEVVLHYRYNKGREQSLMMTESFDGIYTKEFTMFYRDTLEWYLTVEGKKEKLQTDPKSMIMAKRAKGGSGSRYDLINQLIEANENHNSQRFREIGNQYVGRQYLVDEIFRIN